MDIFNNQWVVGIGGGVLSSLLVTVITGKFFASKDNREYLQKVRLANNEVLYAIKPFIVDGDVPRIDVIQSLQVATARKHAIDFNDIASITEIIENLTKEVMDSSFISNMAKNEYCEKLFKLKPKEAKLDELEKHKSQAIAEYRHRSLKAFSIILGGFSGLLTAYVGFLVSSDSVLISKLGLLLPSFLAFLMAYFAIAFLKIAKDKKLNTGKENSEQSSSVALESRG